MRREMSLRFAKRRCLGDLILEGRVVGARVLEAREDVCALCEAHVPGACVEAVGGDGTSARGVGCTC